MMIMPLFKLTAGLQESNDSQPLQLFMSDDPCHPLNCVRFLSVYILFVRLF